MQADEKLQVLDGQGALERVGPGALPSARLEALYRGLVRARVVDERLTALREAGRLGFYLPTRGQEAVAVGAAAALAPEDWIFPSLRELGAALYRGLPLVELLAQLLGRAGDPAHGRQQPLHGTARSLHLVSASTSVGTQLPQAVGAAVAARRRGDRAIALAFCGEAAITTGGFHAGLNLAGVWRAPVVFVVRALGPLDAARWGVAYGLTGVRVDGGDALAMVAAVEGARARGLAGQGATLIAAELEGEGDPVERLRRHLEAAGGLAAADEVQLRDELEADLDEALARVERQPPPAPATLFDDVFGELPPHLRAQRAERLDEVGG